MSILELVLKSCLLFFLGGAARIDYLKRELPLIYIVVGFGVGLLLRILSGTAALAEILPGFIPGLLCLLIAKLSKDCHYLDLSIHTVSAGDIDEARNANGGKYYPCSCAKHAAAGSYYVTDYGTNYHADLSCSGLKRTIREVDISEVSSMHACPKCGGDH